MSVPTNLIPTKVTGLPEYTGSGTYGYMPYVIDGRTYKVQFSNIAAVGAVPSSRTIATGTGLTGGGDLSQDRTIAIAPEGVSFDQLAPSGVVAGVYGSGTAIPVVTVDAKGRVTSATTTPLSISGYVPTSRSVFAGTGLTGGGDLASDVTLAVNFSDNNPQALGTATAGVSTAAARGDHVHPAVDLSDTSQTQGALPLGRGGTGDALSPVAGAVVYSTGTKFALTNPGIAGQVLMSNGVDEPVWATVTGIGTVTSVNASGGTTGLTFTGGPVTTAGTLTLGGTLAVTHGGTGATDAATARSNLGAAASGANSDITSMSGITGAIGTPDYIDFDTAATVSRATGRLWWDNADGNQTLSLGMAGGNATLQIGEEMYFRIKASSAITEGQAVMFTGTLGASGGLTGAPATGLTKDTASYLMGVATEDIPLNSWGYVTQFGLVRSFNTTGGAEAWVDGQILYYNPAVPGGLTKTVPTAPAAKIEVAAVVHAASNGSVFVRPTARFSLTQLNDVETSAASDLDLLQYNGTSGVWQHKSPSLISVGSATNLAGGAANRIAYQTGAGATGFVVAPTVANTYLEWSGSGFQWSANPLGTVTSVDASGGTTGLTFSGGPVTTAGTLTLGGTLGVANGGTGATSFTSGYLLKGNGTSAVNTSNVYDDGINVGVGTSTPNARLTVAGAITSYQAGVTDQIIFTPQTAGSGALLLAVNEANNAYRQMTIDGSPVVINTAGTERMRIDGSGNVGIGTASPGAKLAVVGTTKIGEGAASNTSKLMVNTLSGTAAGIQLFQDGNESWIIQNPASTTALTFANSGTERMRITGGGDVGIGATPSYRLHVNSGAATTVGFFQSTGTSSFIGLSNASYTTYLGSFNDGSFRIQTPGSSFSDKVTVDISGNVALTKLAFNIDSPFYTGGNITAGANALGIGTTGAAQVGFFTNNSERMRIDSAGNVGIGTSSPGDLLHVNGNIRIGGATGANYIYSASTTLLAIQTGINAPLLFLSNNGATETMRVTSDGQVGVGTSTPYGGRLTLIPSSNPTTASASTNQLAIGEATANSAYKLNAGYIFSGGVYSGSLQAIAGGTGAALLLNADGGNVGIGTTTPQNKLVVSDGGAGGLEFLTNGVIQSYNRATSAYQTMYLDAQQILFRPSGAEAARITSGGQLLSGTTTAVNAGGVFSTTGANVSTTATKNSNMTGMTLVATDNVNTMTGLWFGTGNGSHWSGIAGGRTDNASHWGTHLSFYTHPEDLANLDNANEQMRLTGSGNLGIGSTVPIGKLGVSMGSATGAGNTVAWDNTYALFGGVTAGAAAVAIGFNTSAGGVLSSLAPNTSWRTMNYHAANHVFFFSGAEAMRINTDGNVGIGTSSPGVKLEVNGAIAFGASMTSGVGITTQDCSLELGGSRGGDGNVYFDMHATSGTDFETRFIRFPGTNGGFSLINTGTGDFLLNAQGAAAMQFATSNTERMRIDSSGNVSLGGVAPGTRLDVYSSATDTITAVRNSSVGLRLAAGSTFAGVNAGSVYTTNSVPLVLGTGGSERMRVDTSGNVGIGLTSYSSKLTVAGTIESTTGGIKFPDATTQTTKGIAAAFTQIATVATTSGTTAVFSNIPQTYSELFVAITGVSHDGGTNTYLTWRVSTDGTNYTAAKAVASGTIANTTTVSGIVTIWDYSQDFSEVSTGTITSLNASPYSDFMNSPALVKVTGGVKYISFAWNSGANFDAGSITLYGR